MVEVNNSKPKSLWTRFTNLSIPLKAIIIIFAWPLVLTFYVWSRNFNIFLKVTAIIFFVLFLQIPWIDSFVTAVSDNSTSSKDVEKVKDPLEVETVEEVSEPVAVDPIIKVEYKNLTTNCDEYFMTGTLEVTNLGNVPISGRVELPVDTYEKFMIPLSGVFLAVSPSSTEVINLEGGEGCKKGQKVGEPTTVFTIPATNNLESINIRDAFEWSKVSAICDAKSGFVRLKARVLNVSTYELTAGIQAYLANGPLSEAQKEAGFKGVSYFGTIYKIKPNESREIDFGYGSGCIKGRKGFDGPYFTEFETIFTY